MSARRRTPRLPSMTTLSTAGAEPGTRERLVTPAFIRLTLADVAYFTATGVAIYTLPLWVTGPVGSDTSGAGLAFGAFAVSALILRPIAGRLADTKGRRLRRHDRHQQLRDEDQAQAACCDREASTRGCHW